MKQAFDQLGYECHAIRAQDVADGKRLFVSNWSSESVSVIDTATNKVMRTLRVGMNPNDMKLSADGRLFVACSNDNTVHVIDTRSLQVIERLSTTLTPTGSALSVHRSRSRKP